LDLNTFRMHESAAFCAGSRRSRLHCDTRMEKPMPRAAVVIVAAVAVAVGLSLSAQQRGRAPIGITWPPLGAGPFVLDTAQQHKLRVVVVTKGLKNPWSLAFLPDGQMLVTERGGRLRILRNGAPDPRPLA